MDAATLTQVTGVTLQGAAMIVCIVLWRAYKQAHDDHINDLRKFLNEDISDVRARIMVVEDRDGIPRQERFKYIPAANDKERAALADLDMKNN